jgi:phytoene synthase
MADAPPALASSYAACERIARGHYENFPVASRLMPRGLRPHVAAVYAFARTADDVADEPGREPHERLRLLEEWQRRLHATDPGSAEVPGAWHPAPGSLPVPGTRFPAPDATFPRLPVPDEIFPALHDTIARFDLPMHLFDDLLSAFAQDVTTSRYGGWEALLDYCRRSANPVGRIVLRLSGYHDPDLDRQSDAVCTALQLTNFWQDLAIDWSRGRLYVPESEWRAAAASPADLDRGTWSPEWRHALAGCAKRTRELFDAGRAVCDGVDGRLRYELRATWLGGRRILERLEAIDFDVLERRPRLGPADAVVIAWRALAWRRARRSARPLG